MSISSHHQTLKSARAFNNKKHSPNRPSLSSTYPPLNRKICRYADRNSNGFVLYGDGAEDVAEMHLPSVSTPTLKNQSEKADGAMGSKCTTMRWKRRGGKGGGLSFSAKLPADARAERYGDCICAVKWSSNPFADFRTSIAEMVREVGVRDWDEMEELVYCYVALNPEEVHGAIKDAFLSVCVSRVGCVSDTVHFR